ncbi:hypothetical protein ACFLQ8_00360 [Candidatus Auribacterota bacterium]
MFNDDYQDDELMDYVADFEDALREILDDLPEFRDLMRLLRKKHGEISVFMGVQVMGEKELELFKKGSKAMKKTSKKKPPLRFEFTDKDKKFLKSIKVDLA